MAIDAAIGLAILTLSVAVAAVWLFAVTGAGASEPGSLANSVAFAIVMMSIPAWLAYLVGASCAGPEEGATRGQRRAGIAVEGARLNRAVRLAAHPLGSAGWLWAAGVASLATVPGLPLLLAAMSIIVLAAGLVSVVMLTVRPRTAALHDRVAGTTVVCR